MDKKAARPSVGDVVADDTAAGRGSTARCHGRGHGIATGIIAFARPWEMPFAELAAAGGERELCRPHGGDHGTAAGVFASAN